MLLNPVQLVNNKINRIQMVDQISVNERSGTIVFCLYRCCDIVDSPCRVPAKWRYVSGAVIRDCLFNIHLKKKIAPKIQYDNEIMKIIKTLLKEHQMQIMPSSFRQA